MTHRGPFQPLTFSDSVTMILLDTLSWRENGDRGLGLAVHIVKKTS